MKRKIENGAIWMADEKAVIELKIEKFDECYECEDYTTYETFRSIFDLFKWIAENKDYVEEAIDNGFEVEIVIHSKNGAKEWFFSIDDHGSVRFSMKSEDLVGKELNECEEKLRKIRELVSM